LCREMRRSETPAEKPPRRVYARLGGLSIWVTLLAMFTLLR
jgi:hypothetical protein